MFNESLFIANPDHHLQLLFVLVFFPKSESAAGLLSLHYNLKLKRLPVHPISNLLSFLALGCKDQPVEVRLPAFLQVDLTFFDYRSNMYLDEWLGRTVFHWKVPCFYLRVGLAKEVIHFSGKRSKQLDASGVTEIVEYLLPVDCFSVVVQRVNALKGNNRIDAANVVPQCWQFLHF